jgi:dTDP-4-dehydrorhamnose reductase
VSKKVLLLGGSGKMGTAIRTVFEGDYDVIAKGGRDFDAMDFGQVGALLAETRPDIVINTVAYLGIDPCEKDPERAFRLNTLYPKRLAELSNEIGFLLVHFSTDAVFNDEKGDFYTEEDAPAPLNVYGLTKHGGDCLIQSIASRYYIFRISVLFGETGKDTQFVEKMLEKVHGGQRTLRVSGDIFSSPTYSRDVAREARRIIEASYPYGLYHVANEGRASLYELMKEIAENLGLDVAVEEASYRDFPYVGRKNTCTPLKSIKIDSLRSWKEAVKEYCDCRRANNG